MTETNRKLIDTVIQKAEERCPDSLALIGVYGSAATGDIHPKSDLDLLILINDDRGWQLAKGFILDDAQIGYDLYCTSWQMLEDDAECRHAHLSKLLDAQIVYIKDESAVQRLEMLRQKARNLLASQQQRQQCASNALDNAKKMFADCFLTESLSQSRAIAGAVIHFLLDAVMLSQGSYFRKGVKRTFEELEALHLPFDAETLILNVIRAESTDMLRKELTFLLKNVQSLVQDHREKALPSAENLSGTYEEMFSNWRNKMQEAADRNDLFSSFMNTVSLQFMLDGIAQETAITPINVLEGFVPHCPKTNVQNFDRALETYLYEYQKAGIVPEYFANADDFAEAYLQ